jgi:hypothetical protein
MQILQEEPYNLVPGQVVVARVAAKNVHGMGEYLEVESDVSIQSVPTTMATPGIEPLGGSDDRVKITWAPLYHSSQTGGTELLEYRLFWDEGYLPELSSRITIRDADESSRVMNVADYSQYKFSIQAYNVCGLGSMSPVLEIRHDMSDDTSLPDDPADDQ